MKKQTITQHITDLEYEDCEVLEIKEEKKLAEKMRIAEEKRYNKMFLFFYEGYCIEHDLEGCTHCRRLENYHITSNS